MKEPRKRRFCLINVMIALCTGIKAGGSRHVRDLLKLQIKVKCTSQNIEGWAKFNRSDVGRTYTWAST